MCGADPSSGFPASKRRWHDIPVKSLKRHDLAYEAVATGCAAHCADAHDQPRVHLPLLGCLDDRHLLADQLRKISCFCNRLRDRLDLHPARSVHESDRT
jgi:hypothetical protein